MTPRAKVAVVTGANRGIGLAICKILANDPKYHPLVLYAVSRSGTALKLSPPPPHSVTIKHGVANLHDQDTMSRLASKVQKDDGGCDVLINNAGIYYWDADVSDASRRRETVDVNFRGSLMMCRAFMPIMHASGRIVNVSSVSGILTYYNPKLQARFRDPHNTVHDMEVLAREYEEAARRGVAVQEGWPRKPYFVSKALQIGTTIALAKEHPHLSINACCPGWVGTELGNQAGSAPKTPEEGARIPMRLGFGDIGGRTGTWWANASVSDTGDGVLTRW